MKYPYIVIRNGTWYSAGTEVPADIQKKLELTDVAHAGIPEPEKPKRGRKPKEA